MELGNNKFLNRIPEVSGLQNLRKLNVSNCTILIEIHDSVGRLNRLEQLYADGCSKLTNFPCVMESTYLWHLCLCGCIKLQRFPKILGNCMILYVKSHGKYVRWRSTMRRWFGGIAFLCLESSISMLPRFDKLMVPISLNFLFIEGCNLTDEVLVNWLSCSIPNLKSLKLRDNASIHNFLSARHPCFNNLKQLDMSSNNLIDNLSSWIPWFPNLVKLDLTANSFTTLTACINECRHLKKLVLDNCHQLQTIIDIPSIEYLTAIDCTKLTSQSSSILLSQKLHEDGKTYFTLPGSKIPEWFDHSCQGSSLCFWFCKSFPSIALCLVHFASIAPVHIRTIQLRVNSHKIDLEHFGIYWTSNTDVEHVSLFDLEGKIQFSRSDVELKEYIKDGWNHVEVKVEDIKWIGVHVYKQITNRENIIFGYTPTGSKKRKRVHQ